jgi:hypothetical protein
MTDERKTPDDDTAESTERASGTIDRPIGPGDAQAGDFNERASQLGGPVDVFPSRRDRTGLEDWRSTDAPDETPKQ